MGLRVKRACHALAYLDAAPAGKLLDVGCGDGEFAAKMRDRGWTVRGTELDGTAAAETRRRHGIDVAVGGLVELQLPECDYDAVTVRHVVEHVVDPAAFIAEAWRLLRPGGRLVVITPNVSSLGYRYFGARWRGLEQPTHLFLFRVPSMRALCRAAGVAPTRTFTTAQRAAFVFWESVLAGRGAFRRRLDACAFLILQIVEAVAVSFGLDIGEELVLMADKPRPVSS